jgi:ribosomal protein S18 acetylase RimI-like enzyme
MLKREIGKNLLCRIVPTDHLQEIVKYFLTITFSPSDNFWILKTSFPSKRIIGFGAFLKLSPTIRVFHQKNFKKVIENYKKMLENDANNLEKIVKEYPSFFDLCLKLAKMNEKEWFKVHMQTCRKAKCNSNEIIVGFLLSSVGCEDYSVCPLWRKNLTMRKICLQKTAYINFQTTLTHFRGLGIGWKLFEFSIDTLKKKFNRISTMISIRTIENFHKKIGSRKVSTIPHYYPNGGTGKLYCYNVI